MGSNIKSYEVYGYVPEDEIIPYLIARVAELELAYNVIHARLQRLEKNIADKERAELEWLFGKHEKMA